MSEMTSSKRWLTSRQLKERFGECSDMWIWRRLRDDPKFPKPKMRIRKVRLWDEADVELYEAIQMEAADATD
jgi:predicted DNA-binding transcriptional regulator AlpA